MHHSDRFNNLFNDQYLDMVYRLRKYWEKKTNIPEDIEQSGWDIRRGENKAKRQKVNQ